MALPEPSVEVVARVKTLAAATARPTLTDAQVIASIKAWPKVDRDGITADMSGWSATWDINAIVAELWGVKAGLVAGNFSFSADDASYDKGDVLAHCLAMEAKWSAKIGGSAPTGPYDVDPLHGVVVNG